MLAYFPDKRKKQNHLLEYSLFLWIIFLHFTQQVTVESGHCSTKVTVKQGEGLEVIFDIKLNGFSRMEEAGSEHVGHKGSYFISWVEQSSSARKCSWKNFSTRGGQSITQLNVQIPWRIHNWKNHWPGKQFRIPRLTELLWHKQMQDSNLLRRDNKQSIYLFISVICVTTFHWSSTISGIYLTRQLIFFWSILSSTTSQETSKKVKILKIHPTNNWEYCKMAEVLLEKKMDIVQIHSNYPFRQKTIFKFFDSVPDTTHYLD